MPGERVRNLTSWIFSRRVLIVLAAWIVLSALGTWRHHKRWIEYNASDSWTVVDSMLHVLVLPGWVAAKVTGGNYNAVYSLRWAIIVNTVGFGMLGIGYLVASGVSRQLAAWLRDSARVESESVDIDRRSLLRAAPELAAIAGGGGLVYATLIEPAWIHVRRHDVPIAGLPSEFDGLRVLQITDTHRGPRVTASFIAEAVRLGLAQKPDLTVLTGDYVHQGEKFIEESAALMAPLARAVPTVGVLGNHDWYAGSRRVRETLSAHGVWMVDNDRCFMRNRYALSRDAGGLCIAGVGDLLEDDVEPDIAFAGIRRDVPRLLLSHNPDVAEMTQLGNHRVDLMLSGHTHGGQVSLPLIGAPGVPSRYGQKYARGLVDGPSCRVHISTGVGMSVAPFRFGVPPEINVLTLVRA
ncbi:MAG: metallophosphoesterase [Phycisphaera sp.]|nr:MAG: metallophosphoesterase [Phycisphaera sp.]